MKIIEETNLKDFEFWSGAKDNAELLTSDEFDTVETILEDLYPDGMEDTQINDLFWFDFESVCEWLGTTEEQLEQRKKDEDGEEDDE
jgi:hypothetical protein